MQNRSSTRFSHAAKCLKAWLAITFFEDTTSTCPSCLALLPAQVVIRDGKVYFLKDCKDCKDCGKSEALVSENAKYYVGAYAFARAGTEPLKFGSEVAKGCPTDCETCGDHEQHTCLPIIKITDHCNLECPICIVNNQYANHISTEAFTAIIDTMLANEGQLESIALSGGEPTSHPRISNSSTLQTAKRSAESL
jgi:7,8-dihydro-6-hydroxymethylpterin dimethyltransferase